MNLRFSLRLVLISALFSTSAVADAKLRYWPIEENLKNGRVHFRLIEEDESLRQAQNQISQRVIDDRIVNRDEVPKNFRALAKHLYQVKPELSYGNERFPRIAKPLWIAVKDQWTQADEDDYSAWSGTLTPDFDSGSGLLGDCADIGLLFRWVYARNHQLPIANTLSGSGKLFGHFSSNASWDLLPSDPDWKKDERFKAALRYLFGNTFTRTIIGDIFPTLVTNQYVRPGSMFMIIRAHDGHTQTIHTVDQNGITTFWGNEPAAETIYQTDLIIETHNKMKIGMWRQVRKTTSTSGDAWELVSSAKMPGYSLDQFKQTFSNDEDYTVWLDHQLGVPVNLVNEIYAAFGDFVNEVNQRLTLTADAARTCVIDQCIPGSSDYQSYSTPDKDARIASLRLKILGILDALKTANPDAATRFLDYLASIDPVIVGTGLTYLNLLQDSSLIANFNSDPRVSYEKRWGIPSNINTDFYTNADILVTLLNERTNRVYFGFKACENGCDLNSPTVLSFSTAKLDDFILNLFRNLMIQENQAGLDLAAISAVKKYYAVYGDYADFGDPSCANSADCNMNDVVFGPNAADHLKHFTSNLKDPIATRWGY